MSGVEYRDVEWGGLAWSGIEGVKWSGVGSVGEVGRSMCVCVRVCVCV